MFNLIIVNSKIIPKKFLNLTNLAKIQAFYVFKTNGYYYNCSK